MRPKKTMYDLRIVTCSTQRCLLDSMLYFISHLSSRAFFLLEVLGLRQSSTQSHFVESQQA